MHAVAVRICLCWAIPVALSPALPKNISTASLVSKSNPSLFDNTKLCLHQWYRIIFFYSIRERLPRLEHSKHTFCTAVFWFLAVEGKVDAFHLVLSESLCFLCCFSSCSKVAPWHWSEISFTVLFPPDDAFCVNGEVKLNWYKSESKDQLCSSCAFSECQKSVSLTFLNAVKYVV